MSTRTVDKKVVNVGAMPSVVATFTLENVLTDPTDVQAWAEAPDGAVTELTGQLTSPSVGVWRLDYLVESEGTHWVRITGTGAVAGSVEAEIVARTQHAVPG
jgi:hypothetical protein